jgi:hypothetical protein
MDDVGGNTSPPVSVDDGVGDVEGREEESEKESGGVSVGVGGKDRTEPGSVVGPGSNMLPGGETDDEVKNGLENPEKGPSGGNCGGKMGPGGTKGGPWKGGIEVMMLLRRRKRRRATVLQRLLSFHVQECLNEGNPLGLGR